MICFKSKRDARKNEESTRQIKNIEVEGISVEI